MILPFDLSSGEAIFLAVGLLGAAFIRGYSGFGFSAIVVALASLVTNPLLVIPAIFACEIFMTVFLLPAVYRAVDWRRFGLISIGTLVLIGPSVWMMARLDADLARQVISLLIAAIALFLLSGWTPKRKAGRGGYLAVGALSGMANSAGVGGLPLAAFLTAQRLSPAAFRALMVVQLFVLDIVTLPIMAANDLVSSDTWRAALMALPILGVGIWLGMRSFGLGSDKTFRTLVTVLLLMLSLIAFGRALS